MPRGIAGIAFTVLAAASALGACSSSDDSHAAPISSGGSGASGGASATGGTHHLGGSSATGGSTPHAGNAGASANDGGAAGDGLGGAPSSEGGAAGEPQPGTVVEVPPGTCSPSAVWASPAPLNGVSTTAAEKLLSLTLDELDIAFLRDGALYSAHRTSASSNFGAGAAVTVPTGYDASLGVALSGDGLMLILISNAGTAFGSVSRATRDVDFGATVSTDAFAGLNARAVQTLEHYAAPVLSFDGKALVFSGFTPGADGLAVVYESTLSNGEWSMPNNLSTGTFNGTGTKRPLPTGLSSDLRTLFYFDEGSGKEFAIFRDRPDAPLYNPQDLGALANATVNTKCDHIYYTAAGDVLTEKD